MRLFACIAVFFGLLRSAPINTNSLYDARKVNRPNVLNVKFKPNNRGSTSYVMPSNEKNSNFRPLGPPPLLLGDPQLRQQSDSRRRVSKLFLDSELDDGVMPMQDRLDDVSSVSTGMFSSGSGPSIFVSSDSGVNSPSIFGNTNQIVSESDETSQFSSDSVLQAVRESIDDSLLTDHEFIDQMDFVSNSNFALQSLEYRSNADDKKPSSSMSRSKSKPFLRQASVMDLTVQASRADSPSSKRIVSLDIFENTKEMDDFHKKFEEFKDLLEQAQQEGVISRGIVLRKASEFDASSRKIILNFAFMKQDWYVTRVLLEKGFDPSELLRNLNSLPVDEAREKADLIGYYGIFKDKKDFEYKWIKKDTSTQLYQVKFDKYRFLRSISSDIQLARNSINPDLGRVCNLFVTGGFQVGDKEISKLGEFQKAIAFALMIAQGKWDIVKEMGSHHYSQAVAKRLLDQYPEIAAIQVYEMLSSYLDFAKPSSANLYEFLS